jgi:hypothetical protein
MASCATSVDGSYISGTSRCRNRGRLHVRERLRHFAPRGGGSLPRVVCERAERALGGLDVGRLGAPASATAAVIAMRGSRSSRYGRIRPTACSPRIAARARTAAARTSGWSSRSVAPRRRPPRLHLGPRPFHRQQRPRPHLGRLVVQQQRRDELPLVERFQQVDRVDHVPRIGEASSPTRVSIVERSASTSRRSFACTCCTSRLLRNAAVYPRRARSTASAIHTTITARLA